MSETVRVRLHGELAEVIGYEWHLCVSSVGEAMRAIENISGRKLFKHLLKRDKANVKYEVVVDKKKMSFAGINQEKIDEKEIQGSEICINRKMKTLDIVPVFEGAKKFWKKIKEIVTIIVGIALIIGGLYVGGPLGYAMISAGLALVAAGVSALLSEPPEPTLARDIELKGPNSYIFTDVVNSNKEGKPVPIGYGRLDIGSYVIQATYDTVNVAAIETPTNTSQISSLATTKTVVTKSSDQVFT